MSTPDPTSADRTGASAEAIRAHYDLSDDFFRLFLGPEMVYSAALFDGDDDLDAAQRRKLDYHIAQAGAAGAKRVLDIGCGWGALLRRLTEHANVAHAVGLTLSSTQAAWARRGANSFEVREEDWRDHKPEAPYDAIISIGAFEHFVHPDMAPAEKLDAYRKFFDFCDRVLTPRGRLSLQTIAYTRPRKIDPFIADKIFPDSDLPLIWEPIAAAEHKFELLALRNDRDHYARTLRLWERNLNARRDEAVALVGEAAFDDFGRYLRMSAGAFMTGIIGLLRLTFQKSPTRGLR